MSCGELVETVLSEDSKTKTYRYKLLVPTSAPNIGLAIGSFDIHVDRAMPEMTHFSIAGLVDSLVFSTNTTYQVIEYFEDLLSARFPYALYKQVFVERLPDKFKSYSSMTLYDTNLLYNERVLDQGKEDKSFFTIFLLKKIFYRLKEGLIRPLGRGLGESTCTKVDLSIVAIVESDESK